MKYSLLLTFLLPFLSNAITPGGNLQNSPIDEERELYLFKTILSVSYEPDIYLLDFQVQYFTGGRFAQFHCKRAQVTTGQESGALVRIFLPFSSSCCLLKRSAVFVLYPTRLSCLENLVIHYHWKMLID